jgi:hypothetical protein
VLVPNVATFARRGRELMARRRGRGQIPTPRRPATGTGAVQDG